MVRCKFNYFRGFDAQIATSLRQQYVSNCDFMKNELRTIRLLGIAVIVFGFGSLGFAQDWLAAGQRLLQAGLLWGFVCWCVLQRLDLNRANADAPLYKTLGWGNRLTILRGGLIALTGGFLFGNEGKIIFPAIFYTLAAILDRLDGFAARRSKQVSLLGNELDITFDALGLVVAPLLAISQGKVHWSYLVLSVAYYVYQWALQRRQRQGLAIHPVPPNPLRRTLAGFQMAFIALTLWPLLNPAFTTIASIAFMLPVLFGFAMDWWVVCGKLQANVLMSLDRLSDRYFQPALRVLLIPLLFWVAQAHPVNHVVDIGLLIGTSLILLGVAGRLGALLLFLLLGWRMPDSLISIVLIFTISWILLLGTGRFSLWQWDDEWVKRYDGA